MERQELFNKVAVLKDVIREVLQTMYDALNQGQQKKIVKNEEIKALFDKYGVIYQ